MIFILKIFLFILFAIFEGIVKIVQKSTKMKQKLRDCSCFFIKPIIAHYLHLMKTFNVKSMLPLLVFTNVSCKLNVGHGVPDPYFNRPGILNSCLA